MNDGHLHKSTMNSPQLPNKTIIHPDRYGNGRSNPAYEAGMNNFSPSSQQRESLNDVFDGFYFHTRDF